jgi:PAS domain S-box-containing protein
MMGVNYDVTDSRLAEEALRRSEEKFHGLFSTMSEAFVLFELIRNDAGKVIDCRVLDANSAVEKMTGITPADAIGRTMREIFPDADPFWFDTYGQVEATGKPASFERCFEPLDRFYQTNVYRPAPGQIAIVFTDITERRQAEEELRRSNEELNRFNRAMVGREARMIELKKEVNDLCEQAGQAPRYSLDFEEEPM